MAKGNTQRHRLKLLFHGRASRLLVRCHKYRCESCGRYFNTRLAGIKVWSRTTELLKRNIFQAYNKGVTCKEIADEHRIGVASVERYYHQMMQHKSSHWANRTARAFWALMSIDLRADRALRPLFATWPAAGFLMWLKGAALPTCALVSLPGWWNW